MNSKWVGGHGITRLVGKMSLGVAAAAVASSAFAQSAPTGNNDSPAMSVGLEEIVVTARKREESAQDTPLSISAFDEDVITQRQIASLQDIAGNVPGFTMLSAANDQFNALVGLRGITTLALAQNLQPAVGIYVDGIYQGFSGANLRDPYDVARIEVVKGPQGTLFGRNTTGGAISVIHNLPSEEFEGWAKAGVGNYSQYDVAGMVNLPISDTAAFRLVGSWLEHDGYGDDVVNDIGLNRLEQSNALGTLRLRPSDSLEIIARGVWEKGRGHAGSARPTYMAPGSPSNVEVAAELFGLPVINALTCAAGAPINAAGCPTDLAALPGRLAAAQQAYLGSAQREFLDSALNTRQEGDAYKRAGSLTATYDINDDLQLKSITGYLSSGRYTRHDLDGSPFAIGASVQDTEEKQWTQEVQLNGAVFDRKLTYTAGIFYFHHDFDEAQSATFLPALANAQSTFFASGPAESLAVFGQSTYALTPQLNLTTGLRWTTEDQEMEIRNTTSTLQTGTTCGVIGHVPGTPCVGTFETSEDNVSYLAELDYSPLEDLMLYLKTSRGFRSGGPQQSAPGFAPFDSETVTDYEVGAKSEFFDNRLRVNLALYHLKYDDLQQSVFTVAGGAVVNPVINVGEAEVDGAELEVLARVLPGLTLSAQAAYTDPEYKQFDYPGLGDVSDTPFANVVEWAYAVGADYSIPIQSSTLHLHVDWRWQDDIRFNAAPTLAPDVEGVAFQGDYGLLNGRVALDLGSWGLEVALWARNLLDEEYYTFAFDVVGNTAVPQFGYVMGNTNGPPRTYGVDFKKSF